MARSVARPLPPRATSELPRWLLPVIGGLLLAAGAAALLWRINRTNERLQAEHRLAQDPVLGPWLADQRLEIEALERSGAPPQAPGARRQAEAVWLGRVSGLEFTQREGEGPRLSDVKLKPSYLLAGRRGALDPRGDGEVRISVLASQWTRGEPRAGELWVFAVYRINKGNNVAQAAFPAP